MSGEKLLFLPNDVHNWMFTNCLGVPMMQRAARQLMLFSQYTPFKGRGGYTAETFAQQGVTCPFPQATEEARRVDDFFDFFGKQDVRAALLDRDVLDFGSGFGGRTVEYGRIGARQVFGIEPFQSMIDKSTDYARQHDVGNVEFRLCTQSEIPLQSNSVDVVLSYDVLEHVRDPRQSMREIRRVLRPGGMAYLVFPVYFGALSHHLDYVSILPGLHWFFSPQTLIAAANSIIEVDRKYGVSLQPAPERSFDGTRFVLPQLNGLGGEHLSELFQDFSVVQLHRHGLFRRRKPRGQCMAAFSHRGVPTRLQDAVTSSVSCVIQKTQEGQQCAHSR